jgi:DNA-binding HxlR family transcriptional regulator
MFLVDSARRLWRRLQQREANEIVERHRDPRAPLEVTIRALVFATCALEACASLSRARGLARR